MDREVGGFYPLPHYYHYYYFSSYVKTMFFEFIQGYFCVKKDIMMLCFNHGEYYVIIFQDEPLFLLTKKDDIQYILIILVSSKLKNHKHFQFYIKVRSHRFYVYSAAKMILLKSWNQMYVSALEFSKSGAVTENLVKEWLNYSYIKFKGLEKISKLFKIV